MLRSLRWSAVLTAVLACGGSDRVPSSPSGVLAPGETVARTGGTGPFRVVFAGPEKEASEGAEISVVFDRALRALEAASAATPEIVLRPEVPGRFRWVGARALTFVPERGRLPFATEFTVEVPGALRAADRSALGSPYRFSFSTPRPKVVRTEPREGETGALPTVRLALELNQAVDPKTLREHAKLSANGRPLAFRAERAPDVTKKIVIVPERALPLDSEIRLDIDAGLTGEEGPLAAGRASSFAFRTYGPLRVSSLDCNRETPHGRCAPNSSVGLAFTNPVRFASIKRAVRLEPPVPLVWPRWYEDTSETSYVEIPARLGAGQRYTVVVGAGLKDNHGQALQREFRQEIALDDYFPRVAVGVGDGTLLASERAPIPLVAVNAPRAKVRAAALSREDVTRLAQGTLTLEALVKGHARARDFALPASPTPNQVIESTLDSSLLLGSTGLGVIGLYADYAVDERDPGVPPREKLAKLSDLGIAAKLSRRGSLLWLTQLSTAEAVPNAEIELVRSDGQKKRFLTNADGLVEIPEAEFAPRLDWSSPDRNTLFFASSGPDWNYEKASDLHEPWSSNVPVDLSGEQRDDGLLFTDRGVYRPGDALAVKGIVRRRTPTGTAIPSGATVKLSLKGPTDEVLRKVETRVSSWGTFHANLRLPPASGLGPHWLTAELDRNEFTTSFSVEEYRPAEFRVDVAADGERVRGERAEFRVTGNYLFGTPLAQAGVRYTVTRQTTAFTPPGADALVTDASAFYADFPDAPLAGGSLADASATLDATGSLRVEQLLALPDQRQTERVMLEAEVTDVARQTGAGRAAILVHPGEFYLGLEPFQGFVGSTPSRIQPKVTALSPQGERLKGKRVELELFKRTFTSATENGPYGPETRLKVVDQSVSRCTVTSTQALASCALTVQEPGYHLLRAESRDARGNPIQAATPVYALGSGPPLYEPDPSRLSLVLDKPHYRVGERARVLVKSPFPEAEALITVERAGVLSRERRSLTGALPSFEIPITEQHRPNAFVGVHLVRKMPPGSTEPAYRFGYVELKIDPEEKRLAVEVTPNRRELGPGEEVEVDVSVKDAGGQGRSAEVTLYAVDEGVLLLTGYQVPDPLPVFTATRPLEVGTLETRATMTKLEARTVEKLLFGKGAEGGGGGESAVRRDFQQTAYFNPNLQTDQSGKAHVKFRLPESLTRYRVMAVVVGEGEHFGFGQSDVTTSKRLMVRPALPRFFRVGDRVEAGVVVSSKGLPARSVTVRATVNGLTLEGARERQVQLPPDGAQEVRFAFHAPKAGHAKLTFEAVSGKDRDGVEVERSVSVPTLLEATSVSGATEDAIRERLGDLRGLRSDVGGLELSVAPSVLVGLESTLQALREYPFGCTEQLTSRFVPALLTPSLLGKGEEKPSAATLALMRQILARQLPDGGFGFWEDAVRSHAWVSAYALFVLDHAKRRGLEVPARSLESGKEYLRRYLASSTQEAVDHATAAFVLDVLAALGAPDAGYVNRLFEVRKTLPLFARAALLSALAQGKGDAEPIEALVTELEGSLRVTGASAKVVENVGDEYAVLMDSLPRTHALVLRALLLARPGHALIPALARGLLAERRGGTFTNTQESAFALFALELYRRTREKEPPALEARVFFGGDTPIFTTEFSGQSFTERSSVVPMARLLQASGERSLIFERDGRGTLFYQARLNYARSELPKTPLDAGLFIEKSLRSVDPSELGSIDTLPPAPSATQFRPGDLVLSELLVVSAGPREYVALDDPLPAGFEAVNAGFLTTSSRYDLASSPAGNECPECNRDRATLAEERAVRSTDARRELHDDRVAFLVDHMTPGVHRFRHLARATTHGTFVVPPTRVFDMYEPEIFGRTGALSVEVR